MLCILLSVSFCMSYNRVYKTIYCIYIEYALLYTVKMICERRANAGIGLCRCACRSWPLLSAKYKYKHVAIQRVICVLSIAVGDLQLSGPECTGVQSDGDRCNSCWGAVIQTITATWACAHVVWFGYLVYCWFVFLCVSSDGIMHHSFVYILLYKRERERERERENDRKTEKERVHTLLKV